VFTSKFKRKSSFLEEGYVLFSFNFLGFCELALLKNNYLSYLNYDYFMLENMDVCVSIDKYNVLLMTAFLFKLFSLRYL